MSTDDDDIVYSDFTVDVDVPRPTVDRPAFAGLGPRPIYNIGGIPSWWYKVPIFDFVGPELPECDHEAALVTHCDSQNRTDTEPTQTQTQT